MEIVTVTYTRDKWCMVLQAHSLEKFIHKPCIHYVVIEDDSDPVEWDDLLKNVYKKHKLVLITKDSHPHVYPQNKKMDGYIYQQIIKFKMHQLIVDSKYLILDSKIMFMKSLDLDRTFRYQGSGFREDISNPYLSYWKSGIEFVCRKVNKPIPNRVWNPYTPFLANKKVVEEIMNTLNLEKIFEECYRKDPVINISEFMIYGIFSNEETPPKEYGGGYQNGNLEDTLRIVKDKTTFALDREYLKDVEKRKVILNLLLLLGFDKSVANDALTKTVTTTII